MSRVGIIFLVLAACVIISESQLYRKDWMSASPYADELAGASSFYDNFYKRGRLGDYFR